MKDFDEKAGLDKKDQNVVLKKLTAKNTYENYSSLSLDDLSLIEGNLEDNESISKIIVSNFIRDATKFKYEHSERVNHDTIKALESTLNALKKQSQYSFDDVCRGFLMCKEMSELPKREKIPTRDVMNKLYEVAPLIISGIMVDQRDREVGEKSKKAFDELLSNSQGPNQYVHSLIQVSGLLSSYFEPDKMLKSRYVNAIIGDLYSKKGRRGEGLAQGDPRALADLLENNESLKNILYDNLDMLIDANNEFVLNNTQLVVQIFSPGLDAEFSSLISTALASTQKPKTGLASLFAWLRDGQDFVTINNQNTLLHEKCSAAQKLMSASSKGADYYDAMTSHCLEINDLVTDSYNRTLAAINDIEANQTRKAQSKLPMYKNHLKELTEVKAATDTLTTALLSIEKMLGASFSNMTTNTEDVSQENVVNSNVESNSDSLLSKLVQWLNDIYNSVKASFVTKPKFEHMSEQERDEMSRNTNRDYSYDKIRSIVEHGRPNDTELLGNNAPSHEVAQHPAGLPPSWMAVLFKYIEVNVKAAISRYKEKSSKSSPAMDKDDGVSEEPSNRRQSRHF